MLWETYDIITVEVFFPDDILKKSLIEHLYMLDRNVSLLSGGEKVSTHGFLLSSFYGAIASLLWFYENLSLCSVYILSETTIVRVLLRMSLTCSISFIRACSLRFILLHLIFYGGSALYLVVWFYLMLICCPSYLT